SPVSDVAAMRQRVGLDVRQRTDSFARGGAPWPMNQFDFENSDGRLVAKRPALWLLLSRALVLTCGLIDLLASPQIHAAAPVDEKKRLGQLLTKLFKSVEKDYPESIEYDIARLGFGSAWFFGAQAFQPIQSVGIQSDLSKGELRPRTASAAGQFALSF